MLHKCLSITLADIFTNFEGIVSGPVAFLGSVCLRRALIYATSALGKSEVLEQKIIFNLEYIWVSLAFSKGPVKYFLSIICVNNSFPMEHPMFSLLC